MTDRMIARALLSVSDKTGLIPFAKALARHKVRLISTGGTAKAIKDAGLAVMDVSTHTGFPEIMDGRVKTLHPTVHGGILADRDDPKHQAAMDGHNIVPIDLVVVNLYPFAKTIESRADYDTCIENIDIGGPAMIRAAAKNHKHVTVVTDPGEYQDVIDEMDKLKGAISFDFRQYLAREAFARTASYDAVVTDWIARQRGESWPKRMTVTGRKQQELRYGENPHQRAAVYRYAPHRPGIATATQLQGKELSYNNYNDADAALRVAADFEEPVVVIVKHANPCGVATGKTVAEAWQAAHDCDPVSAFGGVVALNQTLDTAIAEKLIGLFLEVVVAPKCDEAALEILAKKPNLRVLTTTEMPKVSAQDLRVASMTGGLLIQTEDAEKTEREDCTVVTKKQPTDDEWRDLLFAWKIAKHVKSNAIVYARGNATVGIGAGQMNRFDSSRIAAKKASEQQGVEGSVVASDAFFPFADGLIAAVDAGATAAIQPGGSIKDEEVIAAANEAGIAMVFTGKRHFRH
ncbi:MAG: bifunctional phosphoribosylaminoimidazolecarboxamide formyltransferase/IMP cyclohydrolase [Alphaproteobacteria bacterium]